MINISSLKENIKSNPGFSTGCSTVMSEEQVFQRTRYDLTKDIWLEKASREFSG
jgi:hypothetical protein